MIFYTINQKVISFSIMTNKFSIKEWTTESKINDEISI
jgi:hypothetical protein